MNRDEIERKILLADAGELSAEEQATLEQALEGNDEARAWRTETRRMMRSAAQLLPDSGPSDFALTRIRKEAAKAHRKPLLLRHPAFGMLAAAATLALVVSSWLAMNRPEMPSRVDQTQTLVALMIETDSSDATGASPADVSNQNDEEQLRELAQQLLDLQGFSDENLSVVEWEEMLLPTTDPQTRNTRESPASGCV